MKTCFLIFVLGLAVVLRVNSLHTSRNEENNPTPDIEEVLNQHRKAVIANMSFSSTCECGRKTGNTQMRIVYGEEAPAHSHPWLVGLYRDNHIICAGSLINDRYVLTAGHCVKDQKGLVIRMGVHNITDTGTIEVTVNNNTRIHEDFFTRQRVNHNDIALIQLDNRVQFSDKVSPICLPIWDANPPDGQRAIIAGWGQLSEGRLFPSTLQEAVVKLMEPYECENNVHVKGHITPNVMCALGASADACEGDSGGPLIWESRGNGRFEQIGIVSWGNGCRGRDNPGVYTRISTYLEWIVANTRDATYCKDSSINY